MVKVEIWDFHSIKDVNNIGLLGPLKFWYLRTSPRGFTTCKINIVTWVKIILSEGNLMH
jgi:hypothetical protein